MRKLDVTSESWPIAGSFTIARGSKTQANVVVVTLTEDGFTGRGEAVPYGRYNETVPQCVTSLEAARNEINSLPLVGRAGKLKNLNLPKAAQNALDCALWDLESKSNGKPAWQLAQLKQPVSAITAYTLSLDTPEAMAKAAANARGGSAVEPASSNSRIPSTLERINAEQQLSKSSASKCRS